MANNSLATIVSIQPKESSGGSGETREEVAWKMADEMLQKLPNDFLPHEVIKFNLTLKKFVLSDNFWLKEFFS